MSETKKLCPFREKCYRKNPIHFDEMAHPHLEKLLEGNLNGAIELPSNLGFECEDESQLFDQLKVLQLVLRNRSAIKTKQEQLNNSAEQSTQKRPTKSSSEDLNLLQSKIKKEKLDTSHMSKQEESSNRMRESSMFDQYSISSTLEKRMDVRNNALKRMKQGGHKIPYLAPIGEFAMKFALSSPYNIFFSCVQNAPETHTQKYSVTFPELLDISLGEIVESLHINYMVDVGWLCLQYLFSGQKCDSLIILGERADDSPTTSTIEIVTIKTPTAYGTHHSKISVFKYRDGGIRIIISTANLYTEDWENRTQALWMSPHLPTLSGNGSMTEGESVSGFKQDFIAYMKQYNNPKLQSWINTFKGIDFSSIKVFFIGSVPGNFKNADRERWGLQRLRKIFTQNAELPSDQSHWSLIAQASSIGNLGPNFDSWLTQDFIPAMSSEKKSGIKTLPTFRFIYPSIENYKNSFDMQNGSCCLPYSMRTHAKQKWLEKYLYQWKSVVKCRDRAMPHSKIYTRISPDMDKIAWMVLTSGNLSKAAWGYGRGGSWTILNYEAGVILFPQFLINSKSFSISNAEENSIPPIILPYDVPLTPYNSCNSPFTVEFLQG